MYFISSIVYIILISALINVNLFPWLNWKLNTNANHCLYSAIFSSILHSAQYFQYNNRLCSIPMWIPKTSVKDTATNRFEKK